MIAATSLIGPGSNWAASRTLKASGTLTNRFAVAVPSAYLHARPGA